MANENHLISQLARLGFEVGQIHMNQNGFLSVFVNGYELRFEDAYALVAGEKLEDVVRRRVPIAEIEG